VSVNYFHYAKSVFRPKRLESLFLFVTSTCNSLCRTCFYWDELNKGQDLTFDQIARMSETAPPFHKLWISGGEPFLRKDLAEVIELFYTNNGVRHVNLPTNGLLPKKLESVVDQLRNKCPELVVDLNFSLDGLANTHDAIRGVPNNFEKTVATIHFAEEKWVGDRRVRRNVVSCITAENYKELVSLGMKMLGETSSDGHYFEIIRGNPMDPELKKIPLEDLEELHRKLMWFHEQYADKLFSHIKQPARALAKAYYLGNIKLHFDIHQQNHYTNRAWPMACTAGQTTIVVDHDGHFRSCEMRPKLACLQDFNFDVTAALNSAQMQQEMSDIPKANCWCTHACFVHTSTKFIPKVLLFTIPWAYLRHNFTRLPNITVDEIEPFRVKDAPVAS
jgi:MoaA/NifB/PqqE/SkfB family radical SAM enzyme